MDKGWVKLHRAIMENHFLMQDNNCFVVFTKLLMMAGKSKGQWAGGRRQLAKQVNINDNTLKNVLERLETEGIIKREANTKYTVITICNWHKYQSKLTDSHPRVAQNTQQNLDFTPAKKQIEKPVAHPQLTHNSPTTHHSNKKENRIRNTNTKVLVPAKPADPIASLYYQVIKVLSLPVQNHNHVHLKIKQMKSEASEDELLRYLTFMRDHWAAVSLDYKPHVNKGLDIYAKRVQITNIMKQAIVEQKTTTVWKPRAATA